jgi:hypothetical protein
MTPRKTTTYWVTKNIKGIPVFIHTDYSEAVRKATGGELDGGDIVAVREWREGAAHRWALWAGRVVAYLSLGVWLAIGLVLLTYLLRPFLFQL